MFSILGWIVFGLIVGALAKLVMPGRDPGGIVVHRARHCGCGARRLAWGRSGCRPRPAACHGADGSADPARTVPAARRPTRLGVPRTDMTVIRSRSSDHGAPSLPPPGGGSDHRFFIRYPAAAGL